MSKDPVAGRSWRSFPCQPQMGVGAHGHCQTSGQILAAVKAAVPCCQWMVWPRHRQRAGAHYYENRVWDHRRVGWLFPVDYPMQAVKDREHRADFASRHPPVEQGPRPHPYRRWFLVPSGAASTSVPAFATWAALNQTWIQGAVPSWWSVMILIIWTWAII